MHRKKLHILRKMMPDSNKSQLLPSLQEAKCSDAASRTKCQEAQAGQSQRQQPDTVESLNDPGIHDQAGSQSTSQNRPDGSTPGQTQPGEHQTGPS